MDINQLDFSAPAAAPAAPAPTTAPAPAGGAAPFSNLDFSAPAPAAAPSATPTPDVGASARAAAAPFMPAAASNVGSTLSKTMDALKRAGSSVVGGAKQALGALQGENVNRPTGAAGVASDFAGGAQAASDLVGGAAQGVGSLLGSAFHALNPAVQGAVESAGKALLNNPGVADGIAAFKKGVDAFDAWKKTQSPQTQEWVNSAITLLPLAVTPGIDAAMGAAGEGVVGAATKAGGAALEAAAPLTEAAGTAAKAVGEAAASAPDAVSGALKGLSTASDAAKEAKVNTIVDRLAGGDLSDRAAAKSALSQIDTSAAKDPQGLLKAANDHLDELSAGHDVHLDATDPGAHHLIDDFATTKGTTSVNYVQKGIDQLEELYQKTDNLDGQEYIKSLKAKEENEGLTIKEVNDLAKRYGSEKPGFNPNTGAPPTSVTKTGYENVRSGIKDALRAKLPDETSKAFDAAMHDTIQFRDLVSDQVDKLHDAVKFMRKPTIMSKILGAGGEALGAFTKPTVKGIANALGIVTSDIGKLNPIERAAMMEKDLATLTKLTAKGSDESIASRFVKAFQESAQNLKEGNIGMTAKDITAPTYHDTAEDADKAAQALAAKGLTPQVAHEEGQDQWTVSARGATAAPEAAPTPAAAAPAAPTANLASDSYDNAKEANAAVAKLKGQGITATVKEVPDEVGAGTSYKVEYAPKNEAKPYAPPVEPTGTGTPKATSLEQIPEDKTLTGKDATVQRAARAHVLANEDAVLAADKKANGNVINPDNFKKQFKDVGYVGTNAAAVHEPSSYVAKRAYTEALKTNPGDFVIGMGGGSGAAKTTALKEFPDLKNLKDGAAAVLDNNASNYSKTLAKIKEAEAAGKQYVHVYVYRDPEEAFRDTIVRGVRNKSEGGRLVSAPVVADNTIGAYDVTKKLDKEDVVPVRVLDNSLGYNKYTKKPNATMTTMDKLSAKVNLPSRAALTQRFRNIAQDVYDNGIMVDGKLERINKAQLNALLGK